MPGTPRKKVTPCCKQGRNWYEVDKEYFDALVAEIERLKADLAMATDAANKGDAVRNSAEAVQMQTAKECAEIARKETQGSINTIYKEGWADAADEIDRLICEKYGIGGK